LLRSWKRCARASRSHRISYGRWEPFSSSEAHRRPVSQNQEFRRPARRTNIWSSTGGSIFKTKCLKANIPLVHTQLEPLLVLSSCCVRFVGALSQIPNRRLTDSRPRWIVFAFHQQRSSLRFLVFLPSLRTVTAEIRNRTSFFGSSGQGGAVFQFVIWSRKCGAFVLQSRWPRPASSFELSEYLSSDQDRTRFPHESIVPDLGRGDSVQTFLTARRTLVGVIPLLRYAQSVSHAAYVRYRISRWMLPSLKNRQIK